MHAKIWNSSKEYIILSYCDLNIFNYSDDSLQITQLNIVTVSFCILLWIVHVNKNILMRLLRLTIFV